MGCPGAAPRFWPCSRCWGAASVPPRPGAGSECWGVVVLGGHRASRGITGGGTEHPLVLLGGPWHPRHCWGGGTEHPLALLGQQLAQRGAEWSKLDPRGPSPPGRRWPWDEAGGSQARGDAPSEEPPGSTALFGAPVWPKGPGTGSFGPRQRHQPRAALAGHRGWSCSLHHALLRAQTKPLPAAMDAGDVRCWARCPAACSRGEQQPSPACCLSPPRARRGHAGDTRVGTSVPRTPQLPAEEPEAAPGLVLVRAQVKKKEEFLPCFSFLVICLLRSCRAVTGGCVCCWLFAVLPRGPRRPDKPSSSCG